MSAIIIMSRDVMFRWCLVNIEAPLTTFCSEAVPVRTGELVGKGGHVDLKQYRAIAVQSGKNQTG
jgi:hypothetical protein